MSEIFRQVGASVGKDGMCPILENPKTGKRFRVTPEGALVAKDQFGNRYEQIGIFEWKRG